jgi:Na+-translocating ferredoxin:NAD+ oxidoreductase RnfE subunit
MAIIFALTMIMMALVLSLIRHLIPVALRAAMILACAATVVTILHLLMQTFFYEYSRITGMYSYLVAVSCLLLVFAEEEWLSGPVPAALKQAILLSTGVCILLVLIGIVREYIPLHLLHQAPGAFLLLAFVIAGAQWFAARGKQISSVSA